MCQPPCRGGNADKGLFDGLERTGGEPRGFMEQWIKQLQSENLLEGHRAKKFIEYTNRATPLTEMDMDFILKTLDHIKVFEDGTLLVAFLDGTEIECKNGEE